MATCRMSLQRASPPPMAMRKAMNSPRVGSALSGTPLPACMLPQASRMGHAQFASRAMPSSRRVVTVQARYSGSTYGSRGSPDVLERCMAAATYVLPFINAFVYARFLYHMQPLVKACLQPLLPAIAAYSRIPFASFIAFFALYLGVINNQSVSRFVRFNAMQAILLDIGLILPRLIETVISPPSSGWGVQLYANSQSFIWIFVTIWVVYGMFYSLMGQYGRIPFVGEAADAQIR